jgi:hypothetical protein
MPTKKHMKSCVYYDAGRLSSHSEGRKRTDVKTPPCSGVFLLGAGKD